MKVYFLLSVLIASAHYNYAQDDEPDKNAIKDLIIREIMRKISNISLSSLSTASNEKKQLFLGKIKEKLKKTASGLPDGKKYINMIMKEIENKALRNQAKQVENVEKNAEEYVEKKNQKNVEKHDRKIENKETKLKESKPMETNENWEDNNKKKYLAATDKASLKRKLFDNKSKQQIITDIANKINAMAKTHVKNAQTLDQKKNILRKIEGRILESSKRKHMQIHSQHTNLIAYASLIRQGLELSMKKLITSKTRRAGDPTSVEVETLFGNDTNAIDTKKNIEAYKKLFSEIWNKSSIDPHCSDVIEDICNRVEVLLKLPCGDGKSVVLDQLCDGVNDCWNEADEINCVHKAIGKVDLATALMADIDDSITNKCLQPVVDSAIITQHHETLLTMLQSQSQTLKNYQSIISKSDEKTSDLNKDEDSFAKNISSDASKSVSSLLEALEVNLCATHEKLDKSKMSARKSWISGAAVMMEPEIKLNPKICLCDGERCVDCAAHCSHICEQKYMLNRWKCRAVNGGSSVSMNYICDGKSDCFDESDEESCSTDSSISKYEANKIFLELLDILSLKSLSEEYEKSRNKIIELINIVRHIQFLCTHSSVDVHTVKVYRDKYFAKILDIYENAQSSNVQELDHIYDFLGVLKEKIVFAMKRSHMGNDFMKPSSGCYCRNGTCAVIRCPQKCIATCKIEPLLTKFSCRLRNISIDAKAICNGKTDCPNGEDEKNCKTDICRAHHLSMLRQNLLKVGGNLKGTSLGEVLDTWKTKAISSLKVLESRGRPNQKVIKENIFRILESLVSAYATMEDNTRKTNTGNSTLKEFTKLASIVKDTLKSCTQ